MFFVVFFSLMIWRPPRTTRCDTLLPHPALFRAPDVNLHAGVRYDFKPNPSRTYATIGIEGVAPYWFETEAALFLSNKGEVLGRIEGYYDQRIKIGRAHVCTPVPNAHPVCSLLIANT